MSNKNESEEKLLEQLKKNQQILEKYTKKFDILEKKIDKLEKNNQTVSDLQKKINLLNEELAEADEEIAKKALEIEKLRGDATNIFEGNITKSELIEIMREILNKTQHNVIIVVPNIRDLQELKLYEVRAHVSMKVACLINPITEEDLEFVDELDSFENITIRSFEGKDRYVMIRDGEELLFVPIGTEETNYLFIHTKDSAHITLLKSLAMDAWLKGRKI